MMTQYHLEWLLPQEAMLMDKLIMEHHNYFLIYRNQFPDPDFEVLTPPGLDEDDVVPSPSLISDLSGQLEIEVSPETTMSEETSDPQADLPPGLPQQPALPVQPQQRHQAPAGTLNEALRNPGRLCSNSTGQEDHREGQAACEAQSEDWSRKGGDLQDLHQ